MGNSEDEDNDDEGEYEEEDDSITLEDVKDVADTVKSIADAGIAVKKFTETSTPRPPHDPPPQNLDRRVMDRAEREAEERTHNFLHLTSRQFKITIATALVIFAFSMWWTWFLSEEDVPAIVITNGIDEKFLPNPVGDLSILLENAKYQLGDVVEGEITNANPSQPYRTRVFDNNHEVILTYDSKENVILPDGTNKIGFQPSPPFFTVGRYFVVVDDGLELGITTFEIAPKP